MWKISFSCFGLQKRSRKTKLSTGGRWCWEAWTSSPLCLTPHCWDALQVPVPPPLSCSSLNALWYLCPHFCLTPHWLDALWVPVPPPLCHSSLDALHVPVPPLHHNIAFIEVCVWGVVASERDQKMRHLWQSLMTESDPCTQVAERKKQLLIFMPMLWHTHIPTTHKSPQSL